MIWNLELANDPTNPHYHSVDAAMIVPYFINCIIHFVSAKVNKLQYAVPVEQGYIKLHLTMENITHP